MMSIPIQNPLSGCSYIVWIVWGAVGTVGSGSSDNTYDNAYDNTYGQKGRKSDKPFPFSTNL
jgi:hypothetical protein